MKQFVFFAFLLLATFVTNAQNPAPKPLISIIGQSNYELDAVNQVKDILSIPLRLDSTLKFKEVRLVDKVVYMRLNNMFKKSYADAVKMSLADSASPHLQVVVDLAQLRTAGTYEMMVAFDAGNKGRQELTLTLVRPASKLELIDTVRIVQVGDDIQSNPLGIKETSKLSGISVLRLNPPLFPSFNKGNLVSFPAATRIVKTGEIYKAEYTLHADQLNKLPLGRTVGKLEINEPELSAPLVVPFEVIRKRGKWWIIWIIFLGVALGAFLRIYVKNRKEWEEAKLKGYDLLQQMQNDTASIRDENFLNEVKGWRDALGQSLETRLWFPKAANKTNLTKTIEETATKYNERKKKFDEEIKATRTKFTEFSQAFEYTRFTPGIENALAKAREQYNSVRDNLADLDASSAKSNLRSLTDLVFNFLKNYKDSITGLTQWIDNASFYPSRTPGAAVTEINNNTALIKKELEKIKSDSTEAGEQVKAIIQSNFLQDNINNTLQYLEESLERVFEHAYREDGSEVMKRLKRAFDQWQSWLNEMMNDPVNQTDVSPVNELNTAWDAIPPSIQEKASLPLGATTPFKTLSWKNTIPWPERMRIPDAHTASNPFVFSPIVARRNWLFYTLLQTFLIFLLMCLAAYNFYGPMFIGTTSEMITMFLFAFSLDITLDSVVLLRDKK